MSPATTDFPEAETRRPSAVREAFERRYTEVVHRMALSMGEDALEEALSAADPFSGLAGALEVAVSGKETIDPLAGARARAVGARERLVQKADGLLRVSDAAARLGVSVQAVQSRRSRGTILAVPAQNGEWRYPACQFRDGRLLPGIGEVLVAFKDVDPWQQLAILLAPSTRFEEGLSALELLALGRTEDARSIAGSYGEEG